MKKQRTDAVKTRKCLIRAANEVFAEKSFNDATVAEICKKANANIASVNYHFNDKETLYIEAWKCAFDECLKKYPPDGGISNDASPEVRLKGRVKSLISKILNQDYKAFAIMQREISKPTGLLKGLIKEKLEPIHEKMDALVRELAGNKASDKEILLCINSILGQCFHLSTMKKISKMRGINKVDFDDIDLLTDHIVRFSLAGIKEIKKT